MMVGRFITKPSARTGNSRPKRRAGTAGLSVNVAWLADTAA